MSLPVARTSCIRSSSPDTAVPASAGTVVGHVQVVDKGGQIATDASDAVVSVDGVKVKPKPTRATVTMKGKAFVPRIVVIGVGSAVDFPNTDPIFQMSAVIVVRDNPYFTKASADGSFTIEDVPAGKYVLRAWHERGGEGTAEVNVPAQGQVTADLTLDASSFKRAPHKNKFGKDYSGDEKY